MLDISRRPGNHGHMGKTTSIDGRHQRSIDNKHKTAEAVLDLMLETGAPPSIGAIVKRAGISRRTIFRLFKNRDILLIEVSTLMQQRIQSRFPLPAPDPERPLEESVRLLLDITIQRYEYIMPIRLIAEEKKHSSSVVQNNQAQTRQTGQMFIHNFFAPHLQEHPDWDMLHHLLCFNYSWNAWAVLRNDYGLSIEESRRMLERQILAVLGT